MKLTLCLLPDESRCASVAEKMAQAQVALDFHTLRVLPFTGGAAGCVFTSDRFSKIPLFRENPKGNWLMIAGVPIDKQGSLDKRLAAIVDGDHRNAAQSLPELDGAFAAVFWDNEHQKLVIVTDFLGMQPLYVFRGNGVTLMATEVKGLTASGLFEVNMDPAGWGSFFAFGNTIEGATLVQGVKQMPPASVLVFDPAEGWRESPAYWNWPRPKPEMKLEDVDTGELVETMRRDVRAYAEHAKPGTLLLSGGFDSRLIVSLLQEEGLSPKALVLAHRDELLGSDGRFAVRVAKQLGVDYRVITTPKSFYSSEDYLDYLMMIEGSIPSLYLFIAQVPAALDPEMRAVWEGIAPGYALSPAAQYSGGGFKEFWAQRFSFRESLVWKGLFKVFSPSWAKDMYEAFTESLQRESARYSDDEFGVSEFMARNRLRSRTALAPLKVYQNYVLPFTPGVSKALWDLSAGIPYEIKADHKMYLEIFRRHFPKLKHIPYVSGPKILPGNSSGPAKYFFPAINRFRKNRTAARSVKMLRKITTGSWRYWPESDYIGRVIAGIDPGHPHLNAKEVKRLQQSKTRFYDDLDYWMRPFLFYWQMYQWMTEGRLTMRNKEVLFSD